MIRNGLVSGFERYGVRYGVWWDGFGILLDFSGDFGIWKGLIFKLVYK